MPALERRFPSKLDLHAGELVEVRSQEEILVTLDENGELDRMPFMPEMLQYCGKQFRVYKRAHKACNTVDMNPWHLLHLENAVHLEGLRCDGQAHGGCQAACLLFWKEAWLRRATVNLPARDLTGEVRRAKDSPHQAARAAMECTLETLTQKTRRTSDPAHPAEDVYSCQATELPRFAAYLSFWNVRQYVQDLLSGNVSLSMLLRSASIGLFNLVQRVRGGGEYPMYFHSTVRSLGDGKKTPRGQLNLQPGELVQIKQRDDILRTLDQRERNRGLSFDREMVKYCGGRFRVLKRVETIINEKTGVMMHLPNDCIMLEGVVCVGDLHWLCPRAIYAYWREIWLERVE